jgi:PAS domain S-box-containing protein
MREMQMTENPLDEIRRRLHVAEEKLKVALEAEKAAGPPIPAAKEPPSTEGESTPAPAAGREPAPEPPAVISGGLKAVLEDLKESCILVDSNGGWELGNNHLPGWLGYTQEEFQFVNLTDLFEEQDSQRLLNTLPEWLSDHEPVRDFAVNLKGKNGTFVPVSICSRSWVNERNQQFAFLMLENRQAAEPSPDPPKQPPSLMDEALFRIPIPLFVLNPEGLILQANHAAGKWLGLEPEAIPNRLLQEWVDAENRTSFELFLARAVRREPASNMECRIRTNAGTDFPARLTLTPLHDPQGEYSHVLGAVEKLEEEAVALAVTEWYAYGLMVPARLQELSFMLQTGTREFAEHVKAKAAPQASAALSRLMDMIEGARSIMGLWVESAQFLAHPEKNWKFGDLLGKVLAARRPELLRWGIEVALELSKEAAEMDCTAGYILPLLHVLQATLEETQNLAVSAMLRISGELRDGLLELRLLHEVTTPELIRSAQDMDARTAETGVSEMELQIARRLLEAIGGSIRQPLEEGNIRGFVITLKPGHPVVEAAGPSERASN